MSVRALAPFPRAWPSRIRRLQYVAKAGERGMHAMSCRGIWEHVPQENFEI